MRFGRAKARGRFPAHKLTQVLNERLRSELNQKAGVQGVQIGRRVLLRDPSREWLAGMP